MNLKGLILNTLVFIIFYILSYEFVSISTTIPYNPAFENRNGINEYEIHS
jgi:hypothetical protein